MMHYRDSTKDFCASIPLFTPFLMAKPSVNLGLLATPILFFIELRHYRKPLQIAGIPDLSDCFFATIIFD